MIYVIHYRSGDFCGNHENYLAGYFEANSDQEVEQSLRARPLGTGLDGYKYSQLKLSSANELIDMEKKNTRPGSLKVWR